MNVSSARERKGARERVGTITKERVGTTYHIFYIKFYVPEATELQKIIKSKVLTKHPHSRLINILINNP